MKRPRHAWLAIALLSVAPGATTGSPTASLQVSVVVQRSCSVTRLHGAATIAGACVHGRAPAPIVRTLRDARTPVTTVIEAASVRTVEILF